METRNWILETGNRVVDGRGFAEVSIDSKGTAPGGMGSGIMASRSGGC